MQIKLSLADIRGLGLIAIELALPSNQLIGLYNRFVVESSNLRTVAMGHEPSFVNDRFRTRHLAAGTFRNSAEQVDNQCP